MVKINFENLKKKAKKEVEKTDNLKDLDRVFDSYFGKKGELKKILNSLKEVKNTDEKIKIGKKANEFKNFLKEKISRKKIFFLENKDKEKEEHIDITLPGKRPVLGHLHPLTSARRKVEEIFQSMGFEIVEGPEIETEWYNFDALNIPQDHPARDLWDTFYLKTDLLHGSSSNDLLLRTHTSPVQVRYMKENNPPLRIIVPGNVFRHEATDASHEFQLFQIEGLMIDREISVANLKAVIGEFFTRFFGEEVEFRIKPDYFPFVEPGFDIGIKCLVCGGKKCPACKKSGWMEVAGAGMVHPYVFKNSGLISKNWQGWAFGFGLERLVMLKYKINDIRLFRSGDLRFLNQF